MGRQRDPELEQRLLVATWSLLTQDGYDELTFARVAEAAGAHRSDIYRRWTTKAHLVTATVDVHQPPIRDVDTGSLYGDLRAVVDDIEDRWSAASADGIVAWIADLHRDPEAVVAFKDMIVRGSAPLWRAIERAVERGEIEPVGHRQDLVGPMLEGPIMHSHVFARRQLTSAELDLIAGYAHQLLTGPAPR